MGELEDLRRRVLSLELPSATRPQLVVGNPASSRDATTGRIPYGTVVKDTAGTWDTASKRWTAPQSGLYLLHVQTKCTTAAVSVVRLVTSGGVKLWSSVGLSASWAGQSLSGVADIVAGQYVWAEEDTAFTPQNDTAALSNYLMITYLGRTTP
jgi:hypothetical protein